ncbi:MAG TPA: hypothetical protein VME17_11385 [Bryobacteraceae bacterium]|nr:hypothetical protein [Bryobacteraceae bacterium]
MAQRTYRLNRPTLAIANRDGKNIVVTVPYDAYITVCDFPAGSRLADVEWDRQIVKMFVVDIRDRGELIAVAS